MLLEERDPLCPIIPMFVVKRKEWCKPWKNALIVNLVGKKIRFKFLKNKLEKLWVLRASMELIDMGNNYYVV